MRILWNCFPIRNFAGRPTRYRPRWENDSTRGDFETLRQKLFPAETTGGGIDDGGALHEGLADGEAMDGKTQERPLFRVKIQWDFPDFVALQVLAEHTYRKWLTFFLRPLVGGLGIFISLGSVPVLLTEGTVGWLLYALFGFLVSLCAIFTPWLNALGARRSMENHVSEAEFRFYAAEFTTVSSQSVTARPYATILALYRFRGRYFLFFDKRHALFLPFSAFEDIKRAEFEPSRGIMLIISIKVTY